MHELDCYRGVEGTQGSLEVLDRLNIRSCRWQFVPVMYGPWKERPLVHCDIGVREEKPLYDPSAAIKIQRRLIHQLQ